MQVFIAGLIAFRVRKNHFFNFCTYLYFSTIFSQVLAENRGIVTERLEGYSSTLFNQLDVPSVSSTASVNRKVAVSYYDASGWSILPPAGLKSLVPYKTDMVPTISFQLGSGEYATSERFAEQCQAKEG